MPSSKKISSLVINKVPSPEIFNSMKSKGLINEDEVYLVEDENSGGGGTTTVTPVIGDTKLAIPNSLSPNYQPLVKASLDPFSTEAFTLIPGEPNLSLTKSGLYNIKVRVAVTTASAVISCNMIDMTHSSLPVFTGVSDSHDSNICFNIMIYNTGNKTYRIQLRSLSSSPPTLGSLWLDLIYLGI